MSILIEACASEGARVSYLKRGANPMCDYSLHAVATRPAQVGETLITTTFRGSLTRGFASESDPAVAVCMLPGTNLALRRMSNTAPNGSGRKQPIFGSASSAP